MSEPEDQAYLLEEVINRLNNLVRIGQISEVNENGRVKVKIGGITTDWLDVLQSKAGKNVSKYSEPELKETVLVVSPMGDLEQGLVLPGLYTSVLKPPKGGKEIMMYSSDTEHLTLTFGPGKIGINNNKGGSLITAITDAISSLNKATAGGDKLVLPPEFTTALESIKSFS